MAEVVLFHHVRGLTDGVRALAGALRAAGHDVHTPDLFDGRLPVDLDEGMATVRDLGAEVVDARADRAVAERPAGVVLAGVSFGAALAQRIAQTRPGVGGALLLEACLPVSGPWALGPWPAAVPVQVHGMDDDPFFAHEGDLDAARELVATAPAAELHVYRGSAHLFTDSSLPTYDAEATAEVLRRSVAFLAGVDRAAG